MILSAERSASAAAGERPKRRTIASQPARRRLHAVVRRLPRLLGPAASQREVFKAMMSVLPAKSRGIMPTHVEQPNGKEVPMKRT